MKYHWEYFKYVWRHKYFVFVAGRKTKAPLWRLVIHDFSKFSKSEWTPYVNLFFRYKNNRTPEIRNAFDKAWLHHLHSNKHHSEHWILKDKDGGFKAVEMPLPLVKEMIADWMGAGRAITGTWDIEDWWKKSSPNMILHESTRKEVLTFLTELDYNYESK